MAFLSVCSRLNRQLGQRWCILAEQPKRPLEISDSCRYLSTKAQSSQVAVEKVVKVEYPPILDLSPRAKQDHDKLYWHKQVEQVGTIEEKLMKVNMPYYYGLRTIPLQDDEHHYNCLPYFQHWTRTQYEEDLPETWFKVSPEEVDRLVAAVKEQVIEAIAFQYGSYR